MNFWTVFILLLGSFLTTCDSNTDSRDVTRVTSLYDLCPNTDYCSRNATNKIKDQSITPCCLHCTCTEDCWERGICCPDKQLLNKQPLESCTQVDIGNDLAAQRGYYVTKSCPTDARDGALATRCSGDKPASLEDLTWVTDRHTNKIYSNKHCALCNGVTEYSLWQITTNCYEAMNGQDSPDEVIKSFLDNCRLTLEPPTNEDHTDDLCLIPSISTCNVTGQWQLYDEALESACKDFQQIYAVERLFDTILYRNIYCFLCNTHLPLIVDECPNTELLYSKRSDVGFGFSGILDFTAIEEKTAAEANPGPVCAINEVLDTFQSRCLRLSCPALQSPVDGRCRRLLSSTQNLGVTAMLLFYPKEGKTNGANVRFIDMARELSKKVRKRFGSCKRCEETIYVDYGKTAAATDGGLYPAPKVLSMFLFFYTTKECQESLIVEKLNQLLGTKIRLQFGQEKVTLNVFAAPDLKGYDVIYKRADDQYDGKTLPCPTRGLTDFQSLHGCPSVSLNFTDYTALAKSTNQMSQMKRINSLFKLTTKDENSTSHFGENKNNMGNATINTAIFEVQVCFEDYLSVIPKKNNGFLCAPMETVVTILFIISSELLAY